jgi:hypothetical protein
MVATSIGRELIPAEIPADLARRLREGWVTRQEILKILDSDGGARQAVCGEAQRAGLAAERRDRGKPFVVAYRFRELRPGERAGNLIEVDPGL